MDMAEFTQFALVERASEDALQCQSSSVLKAENLQVLYAAVTDMVAILNKERQIVFANACFLEALGYTDLSTVIGLRLGEAIHCIHSSESDTGCGTTGFCRMCGALNAIFCAQGGLQGLRECGITQKGTLDALELLVKASLLNLGEEVFIIVSMKDISHEKRRRILERLFFHDIMNTAVGVRGLSELLDVAGPEELDQFRRMIRRGAETLVEDIKAQRDMVAAENGELELRIEPVNSGDILEGVVELFQSHEVARNRWIKIGKGSERVIFRTDKALLIRVLSNMIKNAIEACEPGETVTAVSHRVNAGVSFKTHNPGFIPEDTQPQIFQRSFTTKGLGRGLGTYSMRLLTERYLKGEISFSSSRAEGTTFCATYPLELEAEPVGNSEKQSAEEMSEVCRFPGGLE